MEKRRRRLLVAVLILALVIGSAGAVFGVITIRIRHIYMQNIEAGDRYLEAGDYYNAILMYQQAIRTDDTKEQGYVKLANAYTCQGNMELAISTLEEGHKKTGSERLQKMIIANKKAENTDVTRTSADTDEPHNEPEEQREEDEEKPVGIRLWGRIEDARTGIGVAGVTVYIYESGKRNEEPLSIAVTNDNGEYSVNLEEGFYSVVLERNGYVTAEKDIQISSYYEESNEDFVLSEESSEEIRLVLEWNSPSCDLDSYLVSGNDWMMFRNKEIIRNGKLAAALDRDARSGHGVETTTIYDMDGSYTFFVYDYLLSGKLQESGATVTIYVPGRDPQTVAISSDAGNCWYVCDINAGEVTVTNYMSEVQGSYGEK